MQPERQKSLVELCALATGLTRHEVMKIASIGPKRYKVYQIPKRSGGQRTICHPSRELKALQYVFLRDFFAKVVVHESATAYKKGSSIKLNALPHVSSRVILKLDFKDFFSSIKVDDWEKYCFANFPHWTEEDFLFSAYVLFWGDGSYQPACLSIGAPTSPLISNAMMFQFDQIISDYVTKNNYIYTRYADDLTISSKEYLDKDEIMRVVNEAIDKIEFPKLELNRGKTRLSSRSTSRRVTGLVINNDGAVSLGRDRKRLISSMVHQTITGKAEAETSRRLAGLLAFAYDVERGFIDALNRKYGETIVSAIRLGQYNGN